MDGSYPHIQFAISTPGSAEETRDHIDHALSLGLPEADAGGKRLHIIANGPTARDFFNYSLPGDTLAVNAGLKLFTDLGLAPTFWAACDPQEHTKNFLNGSLPKQTTYLVASKCHPAVFERLRGLDVRLWHVNDAEISGKHLVPCAVSVTLCMMMFAQRKGYRFLDMWGWDCCFSKTGADHASPSPLSSTPQPIEIEIEGVDERYMSNPTWACEVKDASGILPVLRWSGIDVQIHGRSLISAIYREFAAVPAPALEIAA